MPRQWTLGFHYRRKYSEKAVLTYQFDYYRAGSSESTTTHFCIECVYGKWVSDATIFVLTIMAT